MLQAKHNSEFLCWLGGSGRLQSSSGTHQCGPHFGRTRLPVPFPFLRFGRWALAALAMVWPEEIDTAHPRAQVSLQSLHDSQALRTDRVHICTDPQHRVFRLRWTQAYATQKCRLAVMAFNLYIMQHGNIPNFALHFMQALSVVRGALLDLRIDEALGAAPACTASASFRSWLLRARRCKAPETMGGCLTSLPPDVQGVISWILYCLQMPCRC